MSPRKYKHIIWSIWVITAWQHISTEVTVEGVCCISNSMDGTDDDSCGITRGVWECHELL
jgi:hypothetical protein